MPFERLLIIFFALLAVAFSSPISISDIAFSAIDVFWWAVYLIDFFKDFM